MGSARMTRAPRPASTKPLMAERSTNGIISTSTATTTIAARLPLRCTVAAHTPAAKRMPVDHSQDCPKCR